MDAGEGEGNADSANGKPSFQIVEKVPVCMCRGGGREARRVTGVVVVVVVVVSAIQP